MSFWSSFCDTSDKLGANDFDMHIGRLLEKNTVLGIGCRVYHIELLNYRYYTTYRPTRRPIVVEKKMSFWSSFGDTSCEIGADDFDTFQGRLLEKKILY